MIHILTVHWKSSMWIDIQLKYITEYIKSPFYTYSFLNDVPNYANESKKFNYTSDENIASHAIKLNLLADMACFNAGSDNEILMFIDGDAFPVKPLDDFICDKLKKYPIVAVQRLDNDGDIQPHPCFCVTTVGFWKKIKGDWKAGSTPCFNINGNGIRDVGCILHHKITKEGVSWHKMHRSNKKKYINQVAFGVYDELIYHHGAGFRPPVSRNDKKLVKNFKKKNKLFRKMKKYLPEPLVEKYFYPYNNILREKEKEHDRMYKVILSDFYFHEQL